MNEPAVGQVRAVTRFAAAFLALAAAMSCSRSPAASPVHEEHADAAAPVAGDAGVLGRDAAIRDASIIRRMTVDAAPRAPTVDAQADLCAGTICVAPAHCESSDGFARCACPAGMEFVDLGGDHSPCQPSVASSDDGGDAADGG